MTTDQHTHDEYADDAERFLLHAMSPGESEDFRMKMQQDETLRQRVEELRLLLLAIQETSLRQKLHQFHGQMPARPAQRHAWLRWSAAASLILCISIAGWLFIRTGNKGQRLFSEYFYADPGLISKMGSSDNYAFDRAMVDYKTGHYPEAIQAWTTLQTENTSSDTLNYFIGVTYLALKDEKNAIAYLQKVLSMNNSVFAENANWYIGLALVREGNIPEGIGFIQRSSHKEKKSLLSKLSP